MPEHMDIGGLWGPFGAHFGQWITDIDNGQILGPIWAHFGCHLGSFWVPFGAHFWPHLGLILELILLPILGPILGPGRDLTHIPIMRSLK